MKFSKNGTWKNFKNTNQDYGLYHEKGSLAKYSENSEKPLLIDSYDKLVLMASIDGKCESTLNVRLFEKENLQKNLNSYLAKLPKLMECGTTVFVNCTKILSKGKYIYNFFATDVSKGVVHTICSNSFFSKIGQSPKSLFKKQNKSPMF